MASKNKTFINGSGYGSGDGSGSGYGYGYGDGSGYGSGDGDGYGYWRMVASKTIERFKDRSGFLAFWKSDKNGYPSNGGTIRSGVVPGLEQTVNPPLTLCGPHALHATLNPDKWRGDRLWLVELQGEVLFDDDKCGALKRTILAEIK